MSEHILNHLGELLEMKNRTIRREAVDVFSTYSLVEEPTVLKVLLSHLESPSWDARTSSSEALSLSLSCTLFDQPHPSSVANDEFVCSRLNDLDVRELIKTYKPLLSAGAEDFKVKGPLSSRQQRAIIDQHLDLSQQTTGLSSTSFLTDAEIDTKPSGSNSPSEEGAELKVELVEGEVSASTSREGEADCRRAVVDIVVASLTKLVDARWQTRHGAALAISKVLAGAGNWLTPPLVEEIALRLMQVLCLDRFNDFVSGRSATAPVREAVAQAIAHLINQTKNSRLNEKIVERILEHIHNLLQLQGDNMWVCRQSALLVMKYYFAISDHSSLFDEFFDGVVLRLEDDVDDVVSSAVTALSSLFSNATLSSDKKTTFVGRIMTPIWKLLCAEIKRDNMRAGLDGLVVDLLDMVDTWIREDASVVLTRHQLHTIRETIDPQFRTRTHKAIKILAIAIDRRQLEMEQEDMFLLLRAFYRVLLFAPPTDTQSMLEEVYLTTTRLLDSQRPIAANCEELRKSVGLWMGCLLADHKNGAIDVFAHHVDGPESKEGDRIEKMCSEEMRFVAERDKDSLFVTRKILCAKFVAALIQLLYEETEAEIAGQKMPTALQLLFIPSLKSTSLFHNVGVAILINEWAALWKAGLARIASLEVPGIVITMADAYIRGGNQRTYDETAVCCTSLSSDCNEFVEWCYVRGAKTEDIDYSANVEMISRQAHESCKRQCEAEEDERQLESLNNRYRLLCEQMEHTKLSLKSNTTRVYAFLSSALFYFGFLGDKLTPLIRPLVETMQGERDETVAAEVFRGAIPLLINYSQQRTPKPYVKVLVKAFETFAACRARIPRPVEGAEGGDEERIISLVESTGHGEENGNGEEREPLGSVRETEQISSRNALLLLAVCTTFPVDQLPEFYAYFNLDDEALGDSSLLSRLELHRSLFARVGSQLSQRATSRVISLLESPIPEYRHAGAKAAETFGASRLADTINRLYGSLETMIGDLEKPHARRGAAEALMRLSSLGPLIIPFAPLLAPLCFARLGDQQPEVRDAAGMAFRAFLPLLAIKRDTSARPEDLSDDLWQKCLANRAFVHLLSDPSRLETVSTKEIGSLSDEVELRQYQLEGITWMRYLRRFGLCGILADDMGLGKTLMTLCAIIMAHDEAANARPSLVICPRTLVEHWKAEWRKYFPSRYTMVLSGDSASKTSMERAQLVVVSYDEMKWNEIFGTITWRYVVLDEGHILRNPRTNLFRAVSRLRSETRLVLSGTPVQNSSADLWALFAFLIPGYLGDEKYFRHTFIRPIQQCRSPKASEANMKEGQEALGKLHRLVLPFVLRRLKNDVLRELPEKVVADYECTLTDLQRKVYEVIVDRCCSSPTGMRALSPLHALISLRKVVDHPSLVLDIAEELQLTEDLKMRLRNDELALSGKMQALGQLLAECGILKREDEEERDMKGDEDSVSALLSSASSHSHRALIFCQWRASVSLVSRALTAGFQDGGKGTSISHLVLDGNVAPDDRQRLVDRFNHDTSVDVLVLTTHIGGVGLNLTGADVVIFLDHDWNPMKDLQAIDRAHRLGQTKNVNVYRLITKGTIEEKVMSYQKFKKNTADALIGAENRSLSSMKTDELLSMFALEEATTEGGEGKAPKTKKRRVDVKATAEETWDLSEMWDETQYETAFNIHSFLKDANK